MLDRYEALSDTIEAASRFGLSGEDMFGIFSKFTPVGVWRTDLDTGLVFCCSYFSALFGIEHRNGPLNMVEITSRIHPEDLEKVMECHEAASANHMSYRKIHRVSPDGISYRYVCWTGRFRAKVGTSGEIIGIIFEVPPHKCDFKFELEQAG